MGVHGFASGSDFSATPSPWLRGSPPWAKCDLNRPRDGSRLEMQSLRPTEPEPRLDPNSRGEGGCGSGSGTHPHLRPPGLTRRWLSGDLVRLAGQAGHALVCRVTSPCAGSGRLWPPLCSPTPDSPLFSLPGTCHRYADISAPQLLLCKGRGRPGPGCGDVCLPHASESLSRRGLAPCQARGAHAADICRKIGKGEGEPGLRHLWGDTSSRPPAAPTASQWKWVFTS